MDRRAFIQMLAGAAICTQLGRAESYTTYLIPDDAFIGVDTSTLLDTINAVLMAHDNGVWYTLDDWQIHSSDGRVQPTMNKLFEAPYGEELVESRQQRES